MPSVEACNEIRSAWSALQLSGSGAHELGVADGANFDVSDQNLNGDALNWTWTGTLASAPAPLQEIHSLVSKNWQSP